MEYYRIVKTIEGELHISTWIYLFYKYVDEKSTLQENNISTIIYMWR